MIYLLTRKGLITNRMRKDLVVLITHSGFGTPENYRFAAQESLFPVFSNANYHSYVYVEWFE